MSGNCQYLKAFGFPNERKCNSPYGLNTLYLKDATRMFSGEREICQADSQIFLGNLMDKESRFSKKIERISKELRSLPTSTLGEIILKRNSLLKQLKKLNDDRRTIRNKECRLETCEHLLTCQCGDCFRRQGADQNISSITVFSSYGYRRNTLNFHKECFKIVVRRIGVNIPVLGIQMTLERAFIK